MTFIVLWFPAPHVDGGVIADRVRGKTTFERGEIDERLERRSGLAFGRDRPVELTLLIGTPAHQGQHVALHVHRHHSALANVVFCTEFIEFTGQCCIRHALQGRVDGGIDDDIMINCPKLVTQRIHHIIGDIIDLATIDVLDGVRRIGQRHLRLGFGDFALCGHGGDHHIGASFGRRRIMVGSKPGRRLHQTRQHRRLRQ